MIIQIERRLCIAIIKNFELKVNLFCLFFIVFLYLFLIQKKISKIAHNTTYHKFIIATFININYIHFRNIVVSKSQIVCIECAINIKKLLL